MPFEILRADITALDRRVDAIVNTANPRPVVGNGTDHAVHTAAGPKLLEARKKIGSIAAGEAEVTRAYGLNAKYVIHTVGPVWVDGTHGEEDFLRRAYAAALARIREKHCRSAAFPLMAAGSYGFPRDKALKIAIDAFNAFLPEYPMDLYLVVFNKEAFSLSQSLVDSVQSYIDDRCVQEREKQERPHGNRNYFRRDTFGQEKQNESSEPESTQTLFESPASGWGGGFGSGAKDDAGSFEPFYPSAARPDFCPAPNYSVSRPVPHPAAVPGGFFGQTLEERLKHRGETFSEATLRIITENNWTDAEVYNRVYIDRRLFSKLRRRDYQPGKNTAILLAFALRLNLDQARDYIGLAGYTLSPSSTSDIIVEYFLQTENYDVIELDSVLFKFGQPTLMKIRQGA